MTIAGSVDSRAAPRTRTDAAEALIFDLDGTVVDTETPEYEAISAVRREHGVEYTIVQVERVIGTATGAGGWIDELEIAVGRSVDRVAASAGHRLVHGRLTDAAVVGALTGRAPTMHS